MRDHSELLVLVLVLVLFSLLLFDVGAYVTVGIRQIRVHLTPHLALDSAVLISDTFELHWKQPCSE